jgi:hypothetical protein
MIACHQSNQKVPDDDHAMIAEWDTDTVFFSDWLEAAESGLLARLRSALDGVPH